MNIKDNANAFGVEREEKFIKIKLSSYLGKDKDKNRKYVSYDGLIFIDGASEYLLTRVSELEAALVPEDVKSVPISFEGNVLNVEASDPAKNKEGKSYLNMSVKVAVLQGTNF